DPAAQYEDPIAVGPERDRRRESESVRIAYRNLDVIRVRLPIDVDDGQREGTIFDVRKALEQGDPRRDPPAVRAEDEDAVRPARSAPSARPAREGGEFGLVKQQFPRCRIPGADA